jgi:hypothetical protein
MWKRNGGQFLKTQVPRTFFQQWPIGRWTSGGHRQKQVGQRCEWNGQFCALEMAKKLKENWTLRENC